MLPPIPPTRLSRETVLAFVVLLAGVADATTTAIGLGHGGHEMNPNAVWLFAHLGIVPALIARVALPAVSAFCLLRWARRDRMIYLVGVASVVLVVVLWCGAATSNAFELP